MNSFNFQIVTVANLAAITTPFPDHICYFTQDTENYYIWENSALKEIFVDASSITWNNITGKPTTISGFGITDAVKVNNGILNYVARFTPNGTTISTGVIQDDGINVAVGKEPSVSYKLDVAGKIYGYGQGNGSIAITGENYSEGAGGTHIGIKGNSYTSGESSAPPSSIFIGGQFVATGSFNNKNYSVQLQDGTETVTGRYLRNMTTDGKGNWANINITEVTNGLSSTLLGAANGIATLDSNSKLTIAQMPISVMDYKGTYDIVTNTPNLVDGTGNQGDVYVCTTAGTRTFGTGNTLTVSVGDWLIYNGTKWEKTLGNNVGSGTVSSVGLSLGTTGTDVSISNSPITSSGSINLNIPTASATARGLLSIADFNTFSGKVSAFSSPTSFVTRFIGTNQIAGGSIQDSGSTASIGIAPSSSTVFSVATTGLSTGINIDNSFNSVTDKYGINVTSGGSGTGKNTSIYALAQNSTVQNTGLDITAQGSSTLNIGGKFTARQATNNYALQLVDGTEIVAGRFLKNIVDGKANWATITAADISGAVGAVGGTNNYVAKFTPNGTTIGNSLIQDDGSNLSVGSTTPSSAALLRLSSSVQGTTLTVYNTKSTANAQGIYVNVSAGDGKGGGFYLSGTSGENIALIGSVTGVGATKNVGGNFIASGAANNQNYSLRLNDGTQAENKFLKSVTSVGEANWAYLPDSAQIMCSDLVTPITASTSILKAFWVAPCYGTVADISAYLMSPQQGGSIFTVQVKMAGATLATLTFPNLSSSSSIFQLPNYSFNKGTLFEIFVTQVGDGTAKGLLTTINYERK